MIITEFYDGQGLGNQLWVYASLRSIAKKLNMPYMVLSPEKFKAKEFLDIDYGDSTEIELVLEKIIRNEINIFNEKMFYDDELKCFSLDYDSDILKINSYTKIDGYFQSEKYLVDDEEFIENILPINKAFTKKKYIEEDTCVLNIRGGEYRNNLNLLLPKSYWLNAMGIMKEEYNIQKFKIVTDDHEYCNELFPDIEIVEKGIAESYIALNQARYLIVSNSSFSYFPIKSQKSDPIVIAPKYWARFDNDFGRWSSPANLYKKWQWLDKSGLLNTYNDCIGSYNDNIKFYNSRYNIRVRSEFINSKPAFISLILPSFIKRSLKKILPVTLIRKISNKINK